jgi:hypothetical protein
LLTSLGFVVVSLGVFSPKRNASKLKMWEVPERTFHIFGVAEA